MRQLLIAVAVLLQLGSTAVRCDDVPVFLWTTSRTQSLPEVFAGHTITDQEFSEDFLQKIFHTPKDQLASSGQPVNSPRILAVFLHEQMSLQDLTRKAQVFNATVKGAVFAHLRNIMTTTQSKFLPSVSSAYESLISMIYGDAGKDTASPGIQVVDISNPSELPSISTPGEAEIGELAPSVVYIIHIPNSASPREIDELIGKVDRELISLGRPYSAIYTGKQSFPIKPEVLIAEDSAVGGKDASLSKAAGRKLQEIYYPSYYLFVNVSNCLYLYAQNITLSVLDQGPWSLPLNPTVDDSSYCGNYSAELSLTFSNVDATLKEVKFLMVFGVTQGMNAGYWLMTNFTVFYVIGNTKTTQISNTEKMWPFFITETPYGLSYSCYELPPISPLHAMDGVGNKTVNVTFSALQVQAFNISNSQFGYYNDCVGFFTITTWAVLIVLFILVGILFFAACMFSGLSTQDRFEDAHGKQLVVNALE